MAIVNLDFTKHDYSDANIYSDEELFQKDQMDEALALWKRFYNNVSNKNKGDDNHVKQYHNTISILADRGAGKTTFILNFLEKIKEYDGALCLKLIDPSLIESKQNPFISIIALIHKYVEDLINNQKLNNLYTPCGSKFDEYNRYKENYIKLLQGLPFIDGVGRQSVYEEWEDEEFISAQGMEKAKASNVLEQSFHEYVDSALKILNKKCLVIPFDDIDTDLKKGFDILEIIRKYLTSRVIIPIITGDLELYSNLVRKAFWSLFDSDYLHKEIEYTGKDGEDFASMINQLENQYLIKLLKPENRITLKSIRDLIDSDNYHVYITNCHTEKNEIGLCYNEILMDLTYGTNYYSINKDIIMYLESLSLRVQMGILIEWNKHVYDKKSPASILDKFSVKDNEQQYSFISKLFGNFWNDVNQKTKNAKELMNNDFNYGLELFNFLINTDSLLSGSNLMPKTSDSVLNKALFLVALKFIPLTNNHKSLIFDYWIRTLFFRNVIERIGVKSSKDIFDRILDFSKFNTQADLSKSVCLANAFYNRYQNQKNKKIIDIIPGTIYLGNNSPLALTDVNHVFSLLPMFGVLSVNKNQYVYFSVYKFFAVIYDLLKTCENEQYRLFIIKLNSLSQYTYYLEPQDIVAPELELENKIENDNWINDISYTIEDAKSLKDFSRGFFNWSKSRFRVSTQLLERIFNRMYDSIMYIDKNRKFNNLAEKWQVYILSLLNATLVEDTINNYNSDAYKLNLNTIGEIEDIFLNNLLNINIEKGYDMYKWINHCPLLISYLDSFWYKILTDPKSVNQSYLEMLKYSRYLRRQYNLNSLLEKNKSALTDLMKLKSWIEDYYFELKRLMEAKNLYNTMLKSPDMYLLKNFNFDNIKDKESKINDKINRLQKRHPHIININQIKISVTDKQEHVSSIKEDVEIEISKLQSRETYLLFDINILNGKISKLASFIKDDYNKIVNQENNRPVFDVLKEIQI